MKQDLHQRVAALSTSQRMALAQKLHQPKTENIEVPRRLVAYVVYSANIDEFEPSILRDALKAKLPSYMVPTLVVPLPSLPRTANGKIDIRALPEPQLTKPSTDIAQSAEPRTAVEKSLAQIWREVLGIESVGIYDNFFELGGDSILSIQIVSQAREAGLRLAPNQLFEQPTIAELAAVVNLTAEVSATQEAVTGSVPLTPIQHWFFGQGMVAPQHWHQAILLELPPSVSKEQVAGAIATLWSHHDALRLRFRKDVQGWQQTNADIGKPPQIIHRDLSFLTTSEQYQAVSQYGSDLYAGLNLESGNALQTVRFFLGANQPSWLLISLHHLVVDGISWKILQRDLRILLSPVLRASAQPAQLPAKTTSFKTWAEILQDQTSSRRAELAFWLAQLEHPSLCLPQDTPDVPLSTEGTASTATVTLDAVNTRALLQTVPTVYNTQINDVLLTALTQTLLKWANKTTGEVTNKTVDSIRLEVEAHGREQLAAEIDLSRTVGWFTATYPVTLQLSDQGDPGTSLKAIKEQLRQIPDKGIGYGMLRYLSDEATRHRLTQFSPPEVLFNYLGQREMGQSVLDSQPTDFGIRLIKDIDLGVLRDPKNQRSYLLEINAWISDGQLHLNWTYDTQRYDAETILGIAKAYLSALKTIITHCAMVEHGGFTPSDFPDVDFSQSELDSLLSQFNHAMQKAIEAIYPLTSLQQAFLWNSLQTSSQSGLLHMRGTLHGELDVALLQQSWQLVIDRHPALRTSIHWEDWEQPVQVVVKQAPLPWQSLDWQTQVDVSQALAEFLTSDRDLGFDFTQTPIMRLTLIRLGDREYELIWSCHHLMLDGWSGMLVVNQVLDTYESLKRGEPLAINPAVSYQTYLRWLKQQDTSAAEHFWQDMLKGFLSPTPLPVPLNIPTNKTSSLSSPLPLSFSRDATTTIQTFLRSHRLTLNTLIQGVWALLLHLRSGQYDIVFGATVSGRQSDLAGIESIVGLLINVLPVRIKLSPQATLLSWLKTLQTQQSQASCYAYASPAQIQSWSGCQSRLFNSLLVIENYPMQATESERSLRIENLRSGIISTYGLTLIVKPGDTLTLFADAQAVDNKDLIALLSDFQSLLNKVVGSPQSMIEQLLSAPDIPTLPTDLQPSTSTTTPHSTRELSVVEVLPRTPLELKLTQIWESILGVSPLSTEANFFDLGGDSLLAVQLFNQMQQQLDCTLPLATLFQAPTVRQFATLLSQSQPASPWSSLVPIQPGGSRRPFFFHGGSADALTWARFSQLLGPDQPFYALQRPDLDGRNIIHTTVENLATACIKDIRTVQPNGPYLVGGHCFGGAVAFEIARQLKAQGEAIASLIEIDAYCPNALPQSLLGQLQEQLQLSHFLLRKSYYYHGGRKQLRQLPKKIRQRLKRSRPARPETQSISQSTSQPVAQSPNTSTSPSPPHPNRTTKRTQTAYLPYEERYARAHQANISAAERYWPQKYLDDYAGRIKIFRADVQILDWRFGKDLGWQLLTKDKVEITTIPGLFGNLFNQRSGPLLADQVRAYLDNLQ